MPDKTIQLSIDVRGSRRTAYRLSLIAFVALLTACGTPEKSVTQDQARVDHRLLFSMPEKLISYDEQVRPILDRRCVVCHGCYDAPCQLKLSSVSGIQRGGSKETVYDGARIKAAEPTRLFIDALTTGQWRDKGFHSVVSDEPVGDPQTNLENSLLYRMLRLKQLHPQPRIGMLSESIDLGLGRSQVCPTVEEFDAYAADFPLQGMPFGMPNLDIDEYTTLVHWLAQGSPVSTDQPASPKVAVQIRRWERFLNGPSSKQQLVSRYIYEHLFQAHIHFAGTDDREFYRLVRSSAPVGQPVSIVATARPYGDPGGPVYYRLVRHQGSIVAKNHLVYEWSDQRLRRYRELFIDPDYQVDKLPSYDRTVASNPIKAFAGLPVKSRYRFLLDDARFFIEGFIKGPVCRGQIALNVIEDQFWVFFFDPDAPIISTKPEYLNAMADYLASPSELEDTFKLFAVERHYQELLREYRLSKEEYAERVDPVNLKEAMAFIWDGQGSNPNAALTIFRHLDSASVSYGLVGDFPETAWVIDYPVLERIHYLLVAGFNVYGNLGHQLNTRLYMDFLRMEGEDYFLTLLPADKRRAIRDSWYEGIRASLKSDELLDWWINWELVTGYQTSDPQKELYQVLEEHVGKLAGNDEGINRCRTADCGDSGRSTAAKRANKALRGAAKMRGAVVAVLPETTFLRVRLGGRPEDDLAYTMISNKAYKHVRSMFANEKLGDRRDYENDTQTVVGWLEGSYPNFFYVVDIEDIEAFVTHYNAIKVRDDYEKFVARYGLRRTDPEFWAASDWFNDKAAREQPLFSGLFDLNRYENR
ncbi:MAG: fatty acid cis/trans isomerase [Gammaproteobacteria bacterium]|nr:fatty acid cis/trans isomerase [Gammaproteobacteria bacterium]